MSNDLGGKTILVTRARGDGAAWCAAVRERGGCALELPCIRCEPVRNEQTRRRLQRAIAEADWLALTSRRGVRSIRELHADPLPPSLRVAAVGEATANACRQHLGRCDMISPDGTGSGLARALLPRLRRTEHRIVSHVVAATVPGGARGLRAVLARRGVTITAVAVYRTLPAPVVEPRREVRADAILLASPSAVEGLVNQVHVPSNAAIVTIGPSTTRAARRLGLEVSAEADRPALDALLEVIP